MSGAETVLALARRREPTLGSGRLVCVDGPAGSGKTTLAAELARLAPEARVVHLDDLYEGWSGLPRVPDQLAALLGPLGGDHPARYRRYDWHAARLGEWVEVLPGPLLVLEGVGAGTAPVELVTVLVWVSAPDDLRLRRGLARDGADQRGHWERWMRDEARHFACWRTEDHADLHLDGSGDRDA